MRHSQATFSRNRLLSSMPSGDFARLRPSLERLVLDTRHIMEEPGQPVRYVYFPEPCVASVVAITRLGERMEVGLFGPEGMSGLSVLHGAPHATFHTFVQVAGQGIRIPTDDLRIALDASATLRALLLRYAQAFSIQVGFTALANGRFTIDERLARWLLMCHDRVDGDSIALTHEFLALMLGVRRAGVTTAMRVLEGAGIVRTSRGKIEIVDREELLEVAGDSYGMPEAEYERVTFGN